jgi:hypothetical protein
MENLQKYENPKTTNDDALELQTRLIHTIIDFIKEKDLTDIYEVEFRADSLQTSADFGHWHPSTDSYLGIYGIQKDEGEKLCVRKFITESM